LGLEDAAPRSGIDPAKANDRRVAPYDERDAGGDGSACRVKPWDQDEIETKAKNDDYNETDRCRSGATRGYEGTFHNRDDGEPEGSRQQEEEGGHRSFIDRAEHQRDQQGPRGSGDGDGCGEQQRVKCLESPLATLRFLATADHGTMAEPIANGRKSSASDALTATA
jgi:hypothetical protein